MLRCGRVEIGRACQNGTRQEPLRPVGAVSELTLMNYLDKHGSSVFAGMSRILFFPTIKPEFFLSNSISLISLLYRYHREIG